MRFINMLSALMLCFALFMPGILYGQAHLVTVKTLHHTGTVQIDPTGITCGHNYTEEFQNGTAVTLHAVPAIGFIFQQWLATALAAPTTQPLSSTALKPVQPCLSLLISQASF